MAPEAYLTAARRGLKPVPALLLADWADEFRVLSRKASSVHGPWRTSKTEYLREPMNRLSPQDPAQDVTMVSGSQVGKTEIGLNWAGETIHVDPWPMLMVQPTVDIAKRFSKQRLSTLIEDSPAIRDRVKPSRERDSGNTLLAKEAPGMILLLAGANSAAGLKSMPIAKLHGDEIDTWPGDVDGEGDPVELATARTRTFPRRKCLWTSTPTELHRSRIWKKWLASSMAHFLVPCPHCGHKQTIEWERIRYDATVDPEKYDPVLICESCGTGIEERTKLRWYEEALGEWVHEFPEREARSPGFHISSLYSPIGWYSWADAARKYEESKDDPELLKVFWNTVLGLPWAEAGEAPEWENLYRRREPYRRGIVPNGGLVLTCAADIQRDRIELEVVAWGPDMESWSVDYVVIPGDTSTIQADTTKPCPWRQLEAEIARVYPREGGGELGISQTCVDSGDQTQVVYAWVRKQHHPRIAAIKGRGALTSPVGIPTMQDVTIRGKKAKRGVKIWPVGVDVLKAELYGWLRQDPPLNAGDPAPRGFCHFPEYGEEHFKGLTAEELRQTLHRGFPVYKWEKIRPRNEQLDCRIYNRAAATIIGVDRWPESDWAKRRAALDVAQTQEPKPARRRKSRRTASIGGR